MKKFLFIIVYFVMFQKKKIFTGCQIKNIVLLKIVRSIALQ